MTKKKSKVRRKRRVTQTEAFADFGATLTNRVWAFSAIADDGALVISCWDHLLQPTRNGGRRYTYRLSSYQGAQQGKNLVTRHVNQAVQESLPVRLVRAVLDDPNQTTAGDASKLKKTFVPDRSVEGSVVSFDQDTFVIDFR